MKAVEAGAAPAGAENDDGDDDEIDESPAGRGNVGASSDDGVAWLGYSSAMHATSARLANGQHENKDEDASLLLAEVEGTSGVVYAAPSATAVEYTAAAAPLCSNGSEEDELASAVL